MDELLPSLSFMKKNKYGFKYNKQKKGILFLHIFLYFLCNCFFLNSLMDNMDLLNLTGLFLRFYYI